ncbi:MAG: asparagine synthase-related protein [Desulfobulbaceae bacterium]|nr:asparagine synthase-related protein [Desulfobulbaceae bacterium]
MSGIAGIFHLDNRPAATDLLEAMAATITHRGPDGINHFSSAQVGLAHCMLHTTPESLGEQLPFHDRPAKLAITADARLDNREDLTEELGLAPAQAKSMADSLLILAAYQKWGEDCAVRLIGDFAFVIWDEKEQKMFCARDHMGVKPFYYFKNERFFAFGSEIKALLAIEDIPVDLCEQRVLDYLVFFHSDKRLTFYENIFTLPAGHCLTLSKHQLHIREHFSFSPHRELHLKNNREYEEAFKETFTTAVKACLRSAFPVGSALSGGLDSSSIVCVAEQLLGQTDKPLLQTFSAIFPNLPLAALKKSDERRYINEVIRMTSIKPHLVEVDRLCPIENLQKRTYDEPMWGFNMYIHEALYQRAAEAKVRVFMDGFDGDTTVSHGYEHLYDLGRNFFLPSLIREATLLNNRKNHGWTPGKIIKEFALRPILPQLLLQAIKALRQATDLPLASTGLAYLLPEHGSLVFWEKRATSLKGPQSLRLDGRRKHYHALTSATYPCVLAMIDATSCHYRLENRFPFWDRRLMEFCLAIPPGQKLQNGFTRSILRRSLAGILPEAIRQRPDKGDLSPNFERRLKARNLLFYQQNISTSPHLFRFIVEEKFKDFLSRFFAPDQRPTAADHTFLFALLSFATWQQKRTR